MIVLPEKERLRAPYSENSKKQGRRTMSRPRQIFSSQYRKRQAKSTLQTILLLAKRLAYSCCHPRVVQYQLDICFQATPIRQLLDARQQEGREGFSRDSLPLRFPYGLLGNALHLTSRHSVCFGDRGAQLRFVPLVLIARWSFLIRAR